LRLVTFYDAEQERRFEFLTNNFRLAANTIAAIYKDRWAIGVSSQGHVFKSVKVRPRLKDSDLVAWEAPWRETKTVEPSDNIL
jgi:putative transposase